MKTDACLGVRQVAERLGVSEKTVRRLIHNSELPAVRIHRRVFVLETDLAAYISSLPNVR